MIDFPPNTRRVNNIFTNTTDCIWIASLAQDADLKTCPNNNSLIYSFTCCEKIPSAYLSELIITVIMSKISEKLPLHLPVCAPPGPGPRLESGGWITIHGTRLFVRLFTRSPQMHFTSLCLFLWKVYEGMWYQRSLGTMLFVNKFSPFSFLHPNQKLQIVWLKIKQKNRPRVVDWGLCQKVNHTECFKNTNKRRPRIYFLN